MWSTSQTESRTLDGDRSGSLGKAERSTVLWGLEEFPGLENASPAKAYCIQTPTFFIKQQTLCLDVCFQPNVVGCVAFS